MTKKRTKLNYAGQVCAQITVHILCKHFIHRTIRSRLYVTRTARTHSKYLFRATIDPEQLLRNFFIDSCEAIITRRDRSVQLLFLTFNTHNSTIDSEHLPRRAESWFFMRVSEPIVVVDDNRWARLILGRKIRLRERPAKGFVWLRVQCYNILREN